MLKSSLCDYSDANILVSGIITTDGEGAYDPAKRLNETEKGVIFKSCAPFSDCISEIDNTQIDNSKDIDVMTMHHTVITIQKHHGVYGKIREMNQLII